MIQQSWCACVGCCHERADDSEGDKPAQSFSGELLCVCKAFSGDGSEGGRLPRFNNKPPYHIHASIERFHTSSSLQARPPPVEAGFLFFWTPNSCLSIVSIVGYVEGAVREAVFIRSMMAFICCVFVMIRRRVPACKCMYGWSSLNQQI